MSETHTIDVDDTRYLPNDKLRVGGLTVSATVMVDNMGFAWATLVEAKNTQEREGDESPRQCDVDYGLRLLEQLLSNCDFYNFYSI
jgi:hypothetical protein